MEKKRLQLKARKRRMAALHAGDLVLTKTEYRYLKDHPEDALAVIGVPGIIMETYRDDFEVLVDWSMLSDNHDRRGRDKWCIDEIVKVGSLGKDVLYPDGEMLHEELFEELTAWLASQVDFSAYPYPGGEEALEARTEVLTWEWLTEIKGFPAEKAKEIIKGWEPSRTSQYHERKIPAGQLQIGDLFTHEDKDYVVTGIQQNGYIRSKPIPSGTVRWFAPHYKVRLVKTAQEIRTPGPTLGFHHVPREEIERMLRGLEGTFGWEGAEKTVFWEIEKATGPLTEEEIGKLKAVIQAISQEMRVAATPRKVARIAVDIRNETRGVHHGQYDGTLIANDPATGEYRGHLDYAHLEEPGEEILIQWVEVPEEFRRQGVASQLVEKLKAENPGREIAWGYTSEEGTALREVLGELKVGDKLLDNMTDLTLTVAGIENGVVVLQWPDVAGSVYPSGSQMRVPFQEVEHALETGSLIRLGRIRRIAPAWVEDEEIWAKAKKEVDRSKYDSEESYYAVVTTVYKNMGGKVKKKEAQEERPIVSDAFILVKYIRDLGLCNIVDYGCVMEAANALLLSGDENVDREVFRWLDEDVRNYNKVLQSPRWKEAQSGTCYQDAFRFVFGTDEGELVHGSITNPDGAVVNHAWVEFPLTGFIWEPESKNVFRLDDFYSAKTPKVSHRYTKTQAGIMAAKTGHSGPWVGAQKKKLSSVEEIKETLEGHEVWTNQLSHGRDVIGVMDGKAWCQLPDTGLTDVTDQIDWNKLMNEMMLQEFGPGWEERLQEEFRVEGGKPTWGDNTIRNTGGGRFALISPEGTSLDQIYIHEHVDRTGVSPDELGKEFEEWLGEAGATIPREQFTLGDLVHHWSYEGGFEAGVKGQAGDTKLRQTVLKGGKKYIRTVTNIEFVEKGDALKLRGVVTIGGIRYMAYHHSGDMWTATGQHYRDIKELAPGLFGSLSPGDWDPRDLKEATADVKETAQEARLAKLVGDWRVEWLDQPMRYEPPNCPHNGNEQLELDLAVYFEVADRRHLHGWACQFCGSVRQWG